MIIVTLLILMEATYYVFDSIQYISIQYTYYRYQNEIYFQNERHLHLETKN